MDRRIILFVTALLVLLAAAYILPMREWLGILLNWIDAHRGISWLVFIAAYIIATVLLAPGFILTVSAGALFGVIHGTMIVSVASTLGATAAFLIGRTIARDWIAQRIQGNRLFKALDRALAHKGFWVVLLTRLSPLFPYNLLNYAYGLTGVKVREYVLGSWIGMAAPTLLYVYIGSLVRSFSAISRGDVSLGSGKIWLVAVGLVATATVVILVTKLAQRALNEELAMESAEQLATGD